MYYKKYALSNTPNFLAIKAKEVDPFLTNSKKKMRG